MVANEIAPVLISIDEAARLLSMTEEGRLRTVRMGRKTPANPRGRTLRVLRDDVLRLAAESAS